MSSAGSTRIPSRSLACSSPDFHARFLSRSRNARSHHSPGRSWSSNPPCFCTSVTDTTDLTGDHAERWETWESCFDLDFSYLHGGPVRHSRAGRYRQWLTHKFGTWHDQFGESGCVGCGRCIVWCPVGIDVTAELAALHEAPA